MPTSRDYPELDQCSRCGANTAFEWDETEGWVSVCCTARAVTVDVEPA